MRRIPIVLTLLAVLVLAGALAIAGAARGTAVARAATCADHATQAEAQAAKDTRDDDGDGRYCESLPCPCGSSAGAGAGAGAGTGGPGPSTGAPQATSADPKTCTTVQRVVRIGLSRTKYPKVKAHWDRAIRKGWPRVLTLRRDGAARRRSKLLASIPTRRGYDRDEYPMASARSSIRADVALVPSGQNRGAGARQGIKLRRYCSGQRFRIVWY